jgi:hypothetical protein
METVLQEVNLTHMLEIHYEPNSFNWYLMKMLEANRHESFDLCYIGGQTWYETGLGFCLVERLLRPGGWVVFDNLFFSFQESNNMGKSWVKKMPKEEQVGRQVEKVFELLVETDPHFGSFRRIGSLGFAQKLKTFWSTEQRDICREAVNISRAIALAYSDSKYRHELLECPDQALSALTGLPCSRFQKLRFIESDHYGPIPHTVNETGTTIVHLEREAPSRILTLMELVKMLVSRVWNKQNECKE